MRIAEKLKTTRAKGRERCGTEEKQKSAKSDWSEAQEARGKSTRWADGGSKKEGREYTPSPNKEAARSREQSAWLLSETTEKKGLCTRSSVRDIDETAGAS